MGLLERWEGSVCLLHYVAHLPWPNDQPKACGSYGAVKGPAGAAAGAAADPLAGANSGHTGVTPSQQSGWASCPLAMEVSFICKHEAQHK